MGDDLRKALTYLRDDALEGPDRTPKSTYLIFTDGSLEKDVGMIGGTLYDSTGKPFSFFSGRIANDVMARLFLISDHPAYEIELLATWTTMLVWQDKLMDSYSCFYLDNEAAKGALIACKSSTEHGTNVVSSSVQAEDQVRCRGEFSHVPTASNPSNAPSCGEVDHLLRAGVFRVALPDTSPL